MPQPPRYERDKDFTLDFGNETDHSALNAEFDSAANSINDIRTNLAILQADDGKLRPNVVTVDSIEPALRTSLTQEVRDDLSDLLAQASSEVLTAAQAQVNATNAAAAAAGSANNALQSTQAAQAAAEAAENAMEEFTSLNLADYAALRVYAGEHPRVEITGYLPTAKPSGIAGIFIRDDTDAISPDNGGTVIVAANGKRWKRVFSGYINVKWFGAKGDSVTDDTNAIKACLAAHPGRVIFFPWGVYIISDTLEIDEHILLGEGVDHWLISFPDQAKQESNGTHFRFVGTGAKRYKVSGTSDMRLAGGWRTNGSPVNGEDGFYKLLNFKNTDAVGTAPATDKLISAAIYVKPGVERWGIKGIRVYPSYNGLEGYNSKTLGLADNWDVGLMVDSAEWGVTEDVQFVGYWRMAGLLLSHAPNELGPYEAGAEHNRFVRSMFQGFRGVSIRGGDYFRCTAVTSSTIEVPWTTSNPLPASGGMLRSGTIIYTWTGTTQTGDKLTLTGVAPDPVASGLVVGAFLRNNVYTTGLGGNHFIDCYISGLDHFSSRPSDELGFGLGVSAAIEANNARGVRFTGGKIATREQVLAYLLEADDIDIDSELEPGSWRTFAGVSGAPGARIIAMNSTPTDAQVPYPAGTTLNLRIRGYANNNVDFEPSYTRTSNRFSGAGLFQPSTSFIYHKELLSAPRTTIRARKGNDGIYLETEDGTVILRATPSGNTEVKGSLVVGNGVSGRVQSEAGQNLELRIGTTARITVFAASGNSAFSGNVSPATDNIHSLGGSVARWTQVYAASAAINTSDEREKQQIEPINAAILRAWGKVDYCAFRFNDAVDLKGDGARWHFGLVAQRVKEAFESEGLDPFAFGLLCYDEWEDQYLDVNDENGKPTGEKYLYIKAGNRYGIRYEEALALECAYLRSKFIT